MARAIRHIRGHYTQPIRIEELAELSALSPATLHRHFRAVTSMTPIQFQKQLRLQEARWLLVSDLAGVSLVSAERLVVCVERPVDNRRTFGRARANRGSPPGGASCV